MGSARCAFIRRIRVSSGSRRSSSQVAVGASSALLEFTQRETIFALTTHQEPAMTDRFLYAVLMVCLALGGSFAIGADLARDSARVREAQMQVVHLETVVITAKRLASNAKVAVTERDAPAAGRAQ
jgi:hypothetical protein